MYEMLVRRSALALVNGEKLWDMHRPLEDDCVLDLLHFQIENPAQVNKAYWRTCSLMLGCVLMNAFKDKIEVILHSFPRPNGKNVVKSRLFSIYKDLEKNFLCQNLSLLT